jgi:hypothetical protein
MYGDGKYTGKIWYDNTAAASTFFAALGITAFVSRKLLRFPWWASVSTGCLLAMLEAFAFFSAKSSKWEDWYSQSFRRRFHFEPSVLWLYSKDTNGVQHETWLSSLRPDARIDAWNPNFLTTLVSVDSNGFKLRFRQQNNVANSLEPLIYFPYDKTTTANLNTNQISGEFPWCKPYAWTNTHLQIRQ